MFRKKRKTKSFDTNLDPLMDVLTCAVGVMLFVVIFAVMEARGVSIKMFTPMLKDPPAKSERKIFLCKKGTIKLFDFDSSAKELLKGIEKIGFDGVPTFVERGNKKGVNDGYFRYKLEYDEWGFWPYQSRSISIICTPIENVVGESIADLKKPSSKIAERLRSFDKNKVWVTFLIDGGESLEVFRKTRDEALKYGFATGWDPKDITFPHKECVVGCGGGGRGKGVGIADTVQ